MIVTFRRTIWSGTSASGSLGTDRLVVTLWSGPNAGIGAFQLTMWALNDLYSGDVYRTAVAQVSEDGKTWVDVTLDPIATATSGSGMNVGGAQRHTLVDGHDKPWLRIGLKVEEQAAPVNSGIQTIEGRLTLIPETL